MVVGDSAMTGIDFQSEFNEFRKNLTRVANNYERSGQNDPDSWAQFCKSAYGVGEDWRAFLVYAGLFYEEKCGGINGACSKNPFDRMIAAARLVPGWEPLLLTLCS